MRKLILTMIIFLPSCAIMAHPGRLNPEGCHQVDKTWESAWGVVFSEGTSHCHDLSKEFGKVEVVDNKIVFGTKFSVEIPDDLPKEEREKFIHNTLDRYLSPYLVDKKTKKDYEKARKKAKKEEAARNT